MQRQALTLEQFTLAPYRIGQLRQAAPHIDAITTAQAGLPSQDEIAEQIKAGTFKLEPLVALMGELVGALSVGMIRGDPSLSIEAIEDQVGLGDVAEMLRAFRDVMAESGGSTTGEAPAPAAPEAAGA